MKALAKAIRQRADGITEPDEVSHFDHQTAELLYALARLLEGKRRDRADPIRACPACYKKKYEDGEEDD